MICVIAASRLCRYASACGAATVSCACSPDAALHGHHSLQLRAPAAFARENTAKSCPNTRVACRLYQAPALRARDASSAAPATQLAEQLGDGERAGGRTGAPAAAHTWPPRAAAGRPSRRHVPPYTSSTTSPLVPHIARGRQQPRHRSKALSPLERGNLANKMREKRLRMGEGNTPCRSRRAVFKEGRLLESCCTPPTHAQLHAWHAQPAHCCCS